MSGHTTYLNLVKPTVGGDDNTWGDSLNLNFDTIDGLFTPIHGLGRIVREGSDGNAATAGVDIDRAAGGGRFVTFTSSTITRWVLGAGGEAESGSNAGSPFELGRYSDGGVLLGLPIFVDRTIGRVTFETTPYVHDTVGPPIGTFKMLHDGNFPAANFEEPIGTIKMYAGAGNPPANSDGFFHYIVCDGRELLRAGVPGTGYPDLFTAIGTAYGPGNGTTTFNIPDLRERIVVCKGRASPPLLTQFPDAALNTVGSKIGNALHPLAQPELPAHKHPIIDKSHQHFIHPSGASASGGGGGPLAYSPGTSAEQATSLTFTGIITTEDMTGGGAGHNNVQPAMVMNYIIRAM